MSTVSLGIGRDSQPELEGGSQRGLGRRVQPLARPDTIPDAVLFASYPEFIYFHGGILFVVLFFAFFVSGLLWSWGCFAFGALVITAPVGGLLCRSWLSPQDDRAALRTLVAGAVCWASGFIPWIYLACEIKGRAVPRRTVKTAYTVLFVAWFVGPVIGGFFSASVSSSDVAVWFPVASLVAWLTSLVWVGFVGITPETSQRDWFKHVVPGTLATLAMLSSLPYDWIA